jgi:hypothetical protein
LEDLLKSENFYAFMEGNFDYLLVIDSDEHVMHCSDFLARDCRLNVAQLDGKPLADIITPASLETFRSAIAQARAGSRGTAVFTPDSEKPQSIPLRPGCINLESGKVCIFLGNRVESLTRQDEWQKNERIKELACLYSVAEWIEVSTSIAEFFTRLPRFLSNGMLYPDEVVVYSRYQDVEYGREKRKGADPGRVSRRPARASSRRAKDAR